MLMAGFCEERPKMQEGVLMRKMKLNQEFLLPWKLNVLFCASPRAYV
jgi:hypothetical protein